MSRLLAALAAAFALTAAPAGASALTWTVTTTSDGGGSCPQAGPCTLRQAINSAAAGDTVALPASATAYTVTSPLTAIKDLTIAGAGARATTISGGSTTQVFDLGTSGAPTITIKGVTITGGKLTGSNGFGAGLILENGTYFLNDVAIVGNTITVSGNAIGGGLATVSATVTLNRSLVANNTATGNAASFGGGIGNGATLTVNDSTITGNQATGPGTDDGGGVSTGQGTGAKVTFTGSTIAGNTAKQGGNVYSSISGGGYVKFARTIISGGTGTLAGANCQTAAGSYTTLGDNLESLNQCGLGAGEKHDTDPLLGAPGDHGGPTDTLGFTGKSPAIGAAKACSGFDQRGFARPSACAIGAVEPQAPGVQIGAEAATAQVGTPYALGASVSDPDGDAGAPTWTFDDGGTAQGTSVQHTFTTAGTHTFTVAVADATGLTASVQGSLDVAAAPTAGNPPPPGDGPAPGSPLSDKTPPVIRELARHGRRLAFKITEAATVTLRIRRCTKTAHHGRTCRRWGKARRITTKRIARADGLLRLPKRLGGTAWPRGLYRAELRAVDASGNRSKLATLRFRIT